MAPPPALYIRLMIVVIVCGAIDASSVLLVHRRSATVAVPAGSAMCGTDLPFLFDDGEGPAFRCAVPTTLHMDQHEVSNARFDTFVRDTGYRTDAEVYGWSFVHELALSTQVRASIEHAVQVCGAGSMHALVWL
jgi:formylglycine-generating enzyme required for sulfatase activity